MKKILYVLCGWLVGLNLYAGDIRLLDEKVIKENFSITRSFNSLNNPEVRVNPLIEKGTTRDFSNIPAYAFSYLNELVVNGVNASNSTIDCVIYSINMKDVPDALIAARDRGVKVRIIIDEGHVYPKADTQIKRLIDAGAGIEVRTLRGTQSYGVNHNKIVIFDRSLVATGSYNWTFPATFNNYENILTLKDREYVEGYIKYFEWMWSKARSISDGPSSVLPVGYYGVPPQDMSQTLSLNGVKVPMYLFSPGSDTENKIAKLIDAANTSVDAVTFSFSSIPIKDALIRAYKRGVNVRFLQDKKLAKSSQMAKDLYEAGVPFKWMSGRNDKGAMHNKFIIIDGKILGTGSFNFTTNASVNSFENIVFTDDLSIINAYKSKFGWFYSQAAAPQSSTEFDSIGSSVNSDDPSSPTKKVVDTTVESDNEID